MYRFGSYVSVASKSVAWNVIMKFSNYILLYTLLVPFYYSSLDFWSRDFEKRKCLMTLIKPIIEKSLSDCITCLKMHQMSIQKNHCHVLLLTIIFWFFEQIYFPKMINWYIFLQDEKSPRKSVQTNTHCTATSTR